MQQAKAARKRRLSSSPIPLEHLPTDVAEKTLQVIVDVQKGTSYLEFKGKRLTAMGQRHIISIPIGRSYRLICSGHEEEIEFVEAISHENYNNRLSSGRWFH